MVRDFKNIKAWQYADDLVVAIYAATKSFPKEEAYGITSQLRRAAASVPANIAEGAARYHKKEYIHQLYIANGSLAETEYLLHLARRIGYLSDECYSELACGRDKTARTLVGLIRAVRSELNENR
jgi:four helix bundle protein